MLCFVARHSCEKRLSLEKVCFEAADQVWQHLRRTSQEINALTQGRKVFIDGMHCISQVFLDHLKKLAVQ